MDIEEIVEDFLSSRARGVYYPPRWFDKLTLDEACSVQLGLLERTVAAGLRHVGWKVGLTAVATREQFGVHEPVFGHLLESGRLASGVEIDLADWIGPGVENELCLRLGAPLRGPGVDAVAAQAAVCSCHPALELVENRGDFGGQLAVAVADNSQQRAFVLGTEVALTARSNLTAVRCEVRINGKLVAQASGEAVMGNPYASVAWLANKLAEHGRGLDAGQYVMTGSFTRQFPLLPGDTVETRFEGVGSVVVRNKA